MVREDYDNRRSSMALTSIALLQERFRQLQRMKELRQEKELLRMLSESKSDERRGSPPISYANHNHETLLQQETFPDSRLVKIQVPPNKPQCQMLSLSLWSGSSDRHAGSRELGMIMEDPSNLVAKSRIPDSTQPVCPSPLRVEHYCGASDIDTSLRL